MMPNSRVGKPSWKLRLFIHSSIMNGSTKAELIPAGAHSLPGKLDRINRMMLRTVISPSIQSEFAPYDSA